MLCIIFFKMTFATKCIESNVCSFFNSISMSKCFVLFEIIFCFRLFNLVRKSVSVTKFASANLASKTSGLVINLSWLWSVSYFLISLIFVLLSVFLAKFKIFSSIAVNAVNAILAKSLDSINSISVILVL